MNYDPKEVVQDEELPTPDAGEPTPTEDEAELGGEGAE